MVRQYEYRNNWEVMDIKSCAFAGVVSDKNVAALDE